MHRQVSSLGANVMALSQVLLQKPWEIKFWFVTFGIEVQVSAHYSQWFCMVKGRQRGRSVGCQGMCGLGHAKVLAPMSKLD